MLDDPKYAEVIQNHGKELFMFCMSTGIAQVGMEEIFAQANKHSSRKLAVAGKMLGDSFNAIANILAEQMKFTQDEIDACNTDILRANEVDGPKIQLLH